MWICNLCHQQFKNNNQTHFCTTLSIADFMQGKSELAVQLCLHFIKVYTQMGEIKPHATKTMIAFKADKNFAYLIKLGKDFIDIVLPFKTAYEANFCFSKIAQVPGTNDYNHHLRIYRIEDINEEVQYYMNLAYQNGKAI